MSLAFEASSFGDYQMQFRDHPAVQGKRDMYPVDPRKLKVDSAYNVRDMDAPDTKAHVAWLKASIIAPDSGGVHTPLEVRLDGKNIFVVAGHCRLAAVLEAIEEGHPIETVPCIPEAKFTSPEDRVVNLIVSNSGKPLSPLETAKVVKRLDGFGWSHKKIAERLGWKSSGSVKQHLEMLGLSEPVKEHIRKGDISATTARNLAKSSELTPEQQEALIAANLAENKRIKGAKKRSTKVTNKTLKRDAKAKAKPPAEVKEEQEATPAPEPRQMVAIGDETHEERQSPAPIDASLPHEQEEVANGEMPDRGNAVAHDGQADIEMNNLSVGYRPPSAAQRFVDSTVGNSPRKDIKDLIDALLPFARTSEINDLNERDDDDTLEISVRDIKRAALAWFKATGETTTGNGEQSEAA